MEPPGPSTAPARGDSTDIACSPQETWFGYIDYYFSKTPYKCFSTCISIAFTLFWSLHRARELKVEVCRQSLENSFFSSHLCYHPEWSICILDPIVPFTVESSKSHQGPVMQTEAGHAKKWQSLHRRFCGFVAGLCGLICKCNIPTPSTGWKGSLMSQSSFPHVQNSLQVFYIVLFPFDTWAFRVNPGHIF